ncbi:hypothetical protein [Xanthobacter aminoxidans]|uniref:hypothetical protein n=1 Tax=Xanthobacter aminoxidans TaxID=186280 RepID=UPI002022E9A7|nr:hypothetical protein [Xanthobacter aminoxidans]MCL8385544.1 hypothetical protein [Xanthobacter aminoxidans]
MSAPEISIRLGLFDSGCLPVLLAREIREVEYRLASRPMREDAKESTETYLRQLKACQGAVDAARAPK